MRENHIPTQVINNETDWDKNITTEEMFSILMIKGFIIDDKLHYTSYTFNIE